MDGASSKRLVLVLSPSTLSAPWWRGSHLLQASKHCSLVLDVSVVQCWKHWSKVRPVEAGAFENAEVHRMFAARDSSAEMLFRAIA
jgi:hypothetical protein